MSVGFWQTKTLSVFAFARHCIGCRSTLNRWLLLIAAPSGFSQINSSANHKPALLHTLQRSAGMLKRELRSLREALASITDEELMQSIRPGRKILTACAIHAPHHSR